MSQELALKFSTADPEQLLGILPTEEVLKIINLFLNMARLKRGKFRSNPLHQKASDYPYILKIKKFYFHR
ncbi:MULTISPECIES: hypothetical protein [Yersinia]|uniref:hypothetical protein n=1 Tax=Yersinia TaxID=629 RepID=UPI0005E99A3B|nr:MULTISPECIES: hypothetical protein [Yersinia]WET13930.1 hypothetical protein P2W49_15210 [Yersinia intermedia]CNH18262.1 Uncharacterised protein [Yersinia intermedia]CRY31410.1 Uncharacterised protein [Yersinia enterocolitica]